MCVASRANWGRLKSVANAIIEHPDLELQLIIAASMLDIPTDLPCEPAAKVQCQVAGDNLQAMTLTAGLFLTQLGAVLDRLEPDIVLIHGDRFEILPIAIAASYTNRVLAQTESGDVSGTIDNKVRDAVSKLSDIHFPVTEMSRQRVISMGMNPDTVVTVGSPALDLLNSVPKSDSPRREPYILVLTHPNTTDPEGVDPLIEAVMAIPMKKVWVNSNTDAGAKAMMRKVHGLNVEFVKHLSPEEYARLLYHAKCAVGNSSSFIKEGAFLGTPAVITGLRQDSREHGENVRFVGYNRLAILKAVLEQISHGRYAPDYRFGDGKSGAKIAEILAEVRL